MSIITPVPNNIRYFEAQKPSMVNGFHHVAPYATGCKTSLLEFQKTTFCSQGRVSILLQFKYMLASFTLIILAPSLKTTDWHSFRIFHGFFSCILIMNPIFMRLWHLLCSPKAYIIFCSLITDTFLFATKWKKLIFTDRNWRFSEWESYRVYLRSYYIIIIRKVHLNWRV